MQEQLVDRQELAAKQAGQLEKRKDGVEAWLKGEDFRSAVAMVLPRAFTPDRFVRVALVALKRNPGLMKCTPASVLRCMMDLAFYGLEPDGRRAHLIPYKDECTLIIDYKGLVELVRRSGEVSSIHADVIHENDEYDFSYGLEPSFRHRPTLGDRGKPIGAYSLVRLKDGEDDFIVMSYDEIEAVRKRSKAAHSGPWVSDWAEMAKKTVFRRHTKWLPFQAELVREVIAQDEEFEDIKAFTDLPTLSMEALQPAEVSA